MLDSEPHVDLNLEAPPEAEVVGDPLGLLFLAGRALAHSDEFESLDVMVVLDQSESTLLSSGGDVNGDGRVEERCEERPRFLRWFFLLRNRCRLSADSVLAAELAAVRVLMGQLDPRSTRVGLASFSGDAEEQTPDAHVWVAPTGNYDAIERGLKAVENQGPLAWTNMAAGIQAGTEALRDSMRDARSEHGRAVRGLIVLVSDGVPKMPAEKKVGAYGYENTRRERQQHRQVAARDMARERRRTIEAAAAASTRGIRIDPYGVGAELPELLEQLAKSTGGRFHSVERSSDLARVFEQVDFSEVEELRIRNVTNGAVPEYALRNADGSFSALVSMSEGPNEIEVYARTMEGLERTVRRRVIFRRDVRAQRLEPEQLAQRVRLLEERLNNLRERNLNMQTERDERLRRELQLQLERERDEAERARTLRVEPHK